MTLPHEGKFAKERFMKKILITLAAFSCAFFIGCQNTTDTSTEDKKDQTVQLNPLDLPLNTIKYKFGSEPITLSGSTFTVVGTSTLMGKPGPGQFIEADTAAALASGSYNKNSNPVYKLVHTTQTAYNSSIAGAANITFNVTVTATEVMGTFSGTTESTTGVTVQVTEGVFRITK